MRFSLHFHEFLTILSLLIFFSKISIDISPIYPIYLRYIQYISDISVKSKYRYIRDYRYFHPWLYWAAKEDGKQEGKGRVSCLVQKGQPFEKEETEQKGGGLQRRGEL